MAQRQISLTEYIAYNNMMGAQHLLADYKQKPAKNYAQLIAGLEFIIKHGKEQGYEDVVNLHPDKQMIIDLFGTSNIDVEGSSSCCGSSCDGDKQCKKCSEKNSSADGGIPGTTITRKDLDDMVQKIKEREVKFAETYPLILFGGVLSGLLYIAMRK